MKVPVIQSMRPPKVVLRWYKVHDEARAKGLSTEESNEAAFSDFRQRNPGYVKREEKVYGHCFK